MPFYVRKAISVGPLRFNISKSGIGVSVGIKGLRIGSGARGNYVHAGRFGLYYRKTVPGEPVPTANIFKSIFQRDTSPDRTSLAQSGLTDLEEVRSFESSSALGMVDSTANDLLEELNTKRNYIPLWPTFLVLAAGAIGGLHWVGASVPMLAGTALAGLSICVWRYWKDNVDRNTVSMYELEPDLEERCARLCAVFEAVRNAGAVWHVASETHVPEDEEADRLASDMKRTRISPSIGTGPKFFTTNVPVPSIPVGRQVLHFLPERALVEAPEGFGAVNYSDLAVIMRRERVVEFIAPPGDAAIAKKVWRYQTKSGEPDRRYRDNRELPVAIYERIRFKSISGLDEVIQVSRIGLGEQLREALIGLGGIASSNLGDERDTAIGSGSKQRSVLARSKVVSGEEVFVSDSRSVREIFRQCIESANLSGPERWIGEFVASDSFTRAEFEKLIADKGLANLPELKGILLDLVLLFANSCVEDHALSQAEIEELGFVISVFHIDDGDFFRARRAELQALLSAQVKWILADRHVTEREEVLQRDLQKLFGLSYDQFVALLQPQASECIEDLERKKTTAVGPEELRLIEISIRNLRSIFLIAE